MTGAARPRRGFNRKAGSFFIVYHLLLVATLPFYLAHRPPNATLMLGTGALLAVLGVTLTVLYHRFYSHRTFELHRAVEAVALLLFGTLTNQGSALEWAFDHRRHHKYTETDDDPHAITKGFWYAHVLWILERRPPVDPKLVPDLVRDPLVMFQHRHYNALMVASNVGVSLLLGWLSGDWLGGFYVGLLVRMFLHHHLTFCINSLAHWWGTKPFAPDQTAVNNPLCSLLTFGEGAHNYHHVFPSDYRIGDGWYHYDPGKWVIWSLARVRLARALKRASKPAIERSLNRAARLRT